tara:strand:+ start:6975 stop:7148 length:174 start_codon:yes stop_codon:yes gene_type:complete
MNKGIIGAAFEPPAFSLHRLYTRFQAQMQLFTMRLLFTQAIVMHKETVLFHRNLLPQ